MNRTLRGVWLAASLLVAVAAVVAELRLAGPPPEHAPA
jgi:hypothetical protein